MRTRFGNSRGTNRDCARRRHSYSNGQVDPNVPVGGPRQLGAVSVEEMTAKRWECYQMNWAGGVYMQAVRETVGLKGKLLARCMFFDKRTKALPAGTEGACI